MDNGGDHGGPVAIIGMACRFPGAAEPAEFHDLTVAGRRMFRPVAGALRAALLDDWARPEPGGQDNGPVQKLAAETTALALADAGFREVAEGGRRGLFLASSVAGVNSVVRGQFGFAAGITQPGPAATSSLHAVAAAAAALSTGELDLAVAGGAELGLDPAWLTAQARAGTLSPDEMRVYAADPAGLLPGEGCGMVVLTRSADAKAAGLPVYAEIAGWSTVPVSASASASALDGHALLQAYLRAGIDPTDIQLIEGEGTGTAAGDLAELTAFAQLRRGGRATAALGAVAAGIGYARAAAGIASLVKTALAMTAGMIPPGTGCAQQHPLIESGDVLLRLPRQPEPWPDGSVAASGARLAAVNSLGTADPADRSGLAGLLGAEGVHLVLAREAEGDRGRGRRRRTTETVTTAAVTAPTIPEVLGAPVMAAVPDVLAVPEAVVVPEALGARGVLEALGAGVAGPAGGPSVFAWCGEDRGDVARRLEMLAASVAGLAPGDLRGLARRLALKVLRDGRGNAGTVRVALVAATAAQLAARAGAAARMLGAGGPGAGSERQRSGLGAGSEKGWGVACAAGEPGVWVSGGAAGRVVVVFGGLAGAGLAPVARLAGSLAALRMLDSLGVTPGAAVGYSLGEITGLVWAGCLPPAEAARLVAQYGQVLRGCGCGPAAMARVAADAGTARALAAADRLHIAAYEGARSHVLAGSVAGIRDLTRRAAAAGVTVEVLDTAHALHSPAMADCAAPLRSVLAGVRLTPPRRRLISTITGRLVGPADDLAEMLAGQLSQPVLFGPAMALAAGQADLIVTVAPDDGLADLAAACCAVPGGAVAGGGVAGGGVPGVAVPGVAGADSEVAARAVAALFAAGAINDVGAAEEAGPRASRLVPRMREGESTGPRTTVRSG
jgi:enediyne polyketide synthase